jgi:hypothetical protein
MLKQLVDEVCAGSSAGGIPAQHYDRLRSYLAAYIEEMRLQPVAGLDEFESFPDLLIAELVLNRSLGVECRSDEQVVAACTLRAQESLNNRRKLFKALRKHSVRPAAEQDDGLDEGTQRTIVRWMLETYQSAPLPEKLAMLFRMPGLETDFLTRALELQMSFEEAAKYVGMHESDLLRFIANHKVTNRMIARFTGSNERDVAEYAEVAHQRMCRHAVRAQNLLLR